MKIQIGKAREEMEKAQGNLKHDKMNTQKINCVQTCTKELIKLNEYEEQNLIQRSIIDWLRMGDGDNSMHLSKVEWNQVVRKRLPRGTPTTSKFQNFVNSRTKYNFQYALRHKISLCNIVP